jgi:hypothetical protein
MIPKVNSDDLTDVIAVGEIRDERIRDRCQSSQCANIATYFVTYRLDRDEKITIRNCNEHLPDELYDAEGNVVEFGAVYVGDGPGQLAWEYMNTIQKVEQRKSELFERIYDLQRTGHLTDSDVKLIEKSFARIDIDELAELFNVDIDGKIQFKRKNREKE